MKEKLKRKALLAVMLLAAAIPACSDARSTRTPAKPTTGTSVHETTDDLIRRLRSTNKNPNPNMDWDSSFPKDYDWKAQAIVEDARRKLTALGKDAFPALIDHVKDPEYSLSFETAIMRAFSVGEVCFMILEDQVDLAGMNYKMRLGSDGNLHTFEGYFSKYREAGDSWYSQDGLRKWWREHEQMTLRQMQIEALEWRIERERAIGFPGEESSKEGFLQPLLKKLDSLRNSPG